MTRSERLFLKGIEHKDWYQVAHKAIATYCKANSIPINDFIDVLALTSPRVSVKRNMEVTKEIFKGNSIDYRPIKTLVPTVQRSIAVWVETKQINGKKTSEFANSLNLIKGSICLDVWMSRAYKVEQKKLFRKDIHSRIVKDIKRLSKKYNLETYQVQACIWSGMYQDFYKNGNVPEFEI